MNKDPLWRVVLCWGSVLIFLLTPVVILTLQILDQLNPRDIEVAKSIGPMYWSITATVMSLAGLGTWTAIKNGKH